MFGKTLTILGAVAILTACGGGGVDNPPDGAVRAVHLASGQGSISFLRVARIESTLSYKQGSAFILMDEDSYDFNLETSPPGSTEPQRILTFPFSVTADQAYTLLIRDNPGGVRVDTFEHPQNSASAGETLIDLLHAAPNVPAVDIYLEAPGTSLTGAMPLGSLGFDDQSLGTSRSEGDYVLTITDQGDPSSVLFTSDTVTLAGETRVLLIVTDTAGDTTAPFSVLLLGDDASRIELFDINVQPALRVVHGASTLGPIDVVIDDDFAFPFASSVQPETLTAFLPLSADAENLKITPAGNSGSFEIDNAFTVPPGQLVTLLVTGSTGSVQAVSAIDEFRAIEGVARVRIYTGQEQEGTINVYIVPPGTDVTDETPTLIASFGAISSYVQLQPGDYQLIFSEGATDDVIGVPTDITLDNGETYGILVVDDPTSRVRAVLFDSFMP